MPSDPIVARAEMERLLAPGRGTTRDPAWFRFGEQVLTPDEVLDVLAPYLTAEREARIDAAVAGRTRAVAVVVEGVVDTGNIAAVMRTADGFGIQEFHVVDTAGHYKHSKRTAQGSEKWLDRRRWRRAADCVEYLRAGGYRIVAAHLDDAAVPIDAIDFTIPTAMVFGNELDGLSAEMVAAADVTTVIPISGFVQSFNLSVAAGVALYRARADRIARLGRHGDLSDEERLRMRAVFAMKSVKHHRPIIERWLAERT
jgi:tRNA (guanosine-2'-O-)-methyltransferase